MRSFEIRGAALIVFFICEVIEKTMAEETPHPEVHDLMARTICEIESSASLGWIHAAFLGQLIRLLGIAPVSPGNSDVTSLDLQSGDWKHEIGLEKESLEKSIADGFMAFLEPEAVCSHDVVHCGPEASDSWASPLPSAPIGDPT